MTEAQSIVFVIDDNAAVRKALDSLIRSVGYQGRNFQLSAGISASETCRRAQLPDPRCPIARNQWARFPAASWLSPKISIPIIFITGHG